MVSYAPSRQLGGHREIQEAGRGVSGLIPRGSALVFTRTAYLGFSDGPAGPPRCVSRSAAVCPSSSRWCRQGLERDALPAHLLDRGDSALASPLRGRGGAQGRRAWRAFRESRWARPKWRGAPCRARRPDSARAIRPCGGGGASAGMRGAPVGPLAPAPAPALGGAWLPSAPR